jgi:hypothetical protein
MIALALALCGQLSDVTPIPCQVPFSSVESWLERYDQMFSQDSVERAEANKPPDGLFDWQLDKEPPDAWIYKFRFNPDYCPFPICTVESSWVRLRDPYDGLSVVQDSTGDGNIVALHPLYTKRPIRRGWAYSLVIRWQGWVAKVPCEREPK